MCCSGGGFDWGNIKYERRRKNWTGQVIKKLTLKRETDTRNQTRNIVNNSDIETLKCYATQLPPKKLLQLQVLTAKRNILIKSEINKLYQRLIQIFHFLFFLLVFALRFLAEYLFISILIQRKNVSVPPTAFHSERDFLK